MIRHAARGGLAAKLDKQGSAKRSVAAPRPGARTQVSVGAVTAAPRKAAGGDPVAGAKGEGYLQRDPEGGLRQVNVYKVNGERIVRAFTRTAPVPPDVLKQLARSPEAAQRAAQAALKRTGSAPATRLGQQPKFNRGRTQISRDV